MNLREYLKTTNLITDGAFGTYFAAKYQTQDIPELANITAPEKVKKIHEEYLNAGAKFIRTNTFASNKETLQEDFAEVEKNIQAAVEIARDAVNGRDAWIAGDIGPIPVNGAEDAAAAADEYYQIAKTFAECGVTVLDFETFADLDGILPAIKKICAEYEMFIMVSFSVNQFGYSAAGLSAKRLLADAAAVPEIDAVGLNCGVGPAHMRQILEKAGRPGDKFLLAIPNAGYPTLTRNKLQFGNTPAYFAEKMKELQALGADILGGCCGTTPEFIGEMSSWDGILNKIVLDTETDNGEQTGHVQRHGFLYDENGERKQKKLIAVELAPPFDADDEKLLESAHLLKNAGVDVLTFPDSPSGRTRVDSVLMASKVRQATGLNVMPHICCRDRNAIAMRSLFLGAAINDIHNFLIITGDPIPSTARQTVKAVFNSDSTGLMKIAKEMNEDVFAKNPLCYGGAINQGRKNLDVEIGRVKKKMEEGAEFFLTQPVFTKEDAARLRRIKEETGATILCGIMPLISRKNAMFMKNEIAGVNVTDEIVARYPEKANRKEGEAAGIQLAKEVMKMVEDFADGYYFSFPFNRVYMLQDIMGK